MLHFNIHEQDKFHAQQKKPNRKPRRLISCDKDQIIQCWIPQSCETIVYVFAYLPSLKKPLNKQDTHKVSLQYVFCSESLEPHLWHKLSRKNHRSAGALGLSIR